MNILILVQRKSKAWYEYAWFPIYEKTPSKTTPQNIDALFK